MKNIFVFVCSKDREKILRFRFFVILGFFSSPVRSGLMDQCSRILAFNKSGMPIRDGSITTLWSKTRDGSSRIGIPDCLFEDNAQSHHGR